MAYLTNNCNGAANGVALTKANSDDNNAGDQLYLVSTPDTVLYDFSWSGDGNPGQSWTLASTGNVNLLGWLFAESGDVTFDIWFQLDQLPGGTLGLFQFRNSGNMGDFQVMPDGRIRISDDAGAEAYKSGAGVIQAFVPYQLQYRRTVGATDGVIEFTLRNRAGAVIDTFSTGTANNGNNNITEVRWGTLNAGFTGTVRFDDPAATTVDPAALTYTTNASYLIDATGSVGALTLTQTSGAAAVVSEPAAGVFVVKHPTTQVGNMTFDLSADGDVTEQITVPPLNMSQTLVFTGGNASLPANWQ